MAPAPATITKIYEFLSGLDVRVPSKVACSYVPEDRDDPPPGWEAQVLELCDFRAMPCSGMHHQHPFAFLPDATFRSFVDLQSGGRISLNLLYSVTGTDVNLQRQVRRCEVVFVDKGGNAWLYEVEGLTAANKGMALELSLGIRRRGGSVLTGGMTLENVKPKRLNRVGVRSKDGTVCTRSFSLSA